MANIPKKVTERFVKAVPRFQKVLQLAKDRDVNESDTVSVLNDIFGEVFRYDKYLEVTSELAIRGTYCDLALKVEDKIQFLVEAKAIGIELKGHPHAPSRRLRGKSWRPVGCSHKRDGMEGISYPF